MDFSWFTITIFDIGILSVSLVRLVWLYRQFNALQKEDDVLKQNDIARQKENAAPRQQFRDFQSAADLRFDPLKAESERQYNALQTEFNPLTGRYAELKDWVMAGRLS